MNNNNVDDLIKRLNNLSVQRTYAEEALETISQETNLVEYQLRVARSAARRDRTTTTSTANKNKNKNNFRVGDTVRITNKHRLEEQGAEGTVTSVSSAYINIRNKRLGATYRRHWRNVALVTATTPQ